MTDQIEKDLTILAATRASDAVESVTQLCDSGPLRYSIALSAAAALISLACDVMVDGTKKRRKPIARELALKFSMIELARAFDIAPPEQKSEQR